MRNLVLTLIASVFWVLVASESAASPVTIDPGAYTGRYDVSGGPWMTGVNVVDLAPGTYDVDTGASIGGSGFTFTVASDGTVGGVQSASGPGIAATAAGTTLTFNTTTVQVDPGAFTGRYYLSPFGYSPFQGPQAFVVVPDIVYYVDLGGFIAGSGFTFTVAADGTISRVNSASGQNLSAVGAGATLSFQTTTVNVDPGAYVGRYYVAPFGYSFFVGPQPLVLVPDVVYSVDTGAHVGGSAFAFVVDADGTVGAVESPSGPDLAATGSGSTLVFNTATIVVQTGAYGGDYYLTSFGSPLVGPQSVVLVPDSVYSLDDGTFAVVNGVASGFDFTVGPAGTITGFGFPTATPAATANGATLTLANVAVSIDPGGYAGAYFVSGYGNRTGPTDVVQMPGILMAVAALGQEAVTVPTYTSTTPPSTVLVLGGQPYTFSFGVAPPVCISIQRGLSGNVADAIINDDPGPEGGSNTNYGSSTALTTSLSSTGQRQGLLRFDLSSIPPGSFVTSATATLHVLLYGGAPVQAHRVTAPWAEPTVTWTSFGEAYLPQVEATFPAANGSLPAGTPVTADLTALVQAWVNGSVPNDGLLLERGVSGVTVFASSEYTQGSRPELDVCYVPLP